MAISKPARWPAGCAPWPAAWAALQTGRRRPARSIGPMTDRRSQLDALAIVTLVANLATDVVYALVDPRIRLD